MRGRIILGIVFLAFFLVGLFVSVTYLFFKNSVSSIIVTAPPGSTNAPATPTPTPDPLAPKGVLLLGYRGDGSLGGYLTDTMLLAYIEPRKEKITLITIPRDLWVPLPIADEKPHYKINSAYAVGLDSTKFPQKPVQYSGIGGAGALSKEIVSMVTGLPVDYFVSLNFEGFKESIDILGGVDVNVTLPFEDKFFPITGKEDDPCDKSDEDIAALTATMSGYLLEQQFTCRYEDLKFDRGVTHMDGETALKFARSRHSEINGNDFARSNRQKQVLIAIRDKVLSIGFISKAVPFLQSISNDVKTDIPFDLMKKYLSTINDYKGYSVSSITLSIDNALNQTYSSDRQYILVPKSGMDNWQSIKDYIQEELSK